MQAWEGRGGIYVVPAARSASIDLPTASNGQFSPLKMGVAGCNNDAVADTSGTGVLLAWRISSKRSASAAKWWWNEDRGRG